MPNRILWGWGGLFILLTLACNSNQVTPQAANDIEQLTFEVQTATPTVGFLGNAPTYTPDPKATATPTLVATVALSNTLAIVETTALTSTATSGETGADEASTTVEPTSEPTSEAVAAEPEDTTIATETPAAPPQPAAEPIRGGAWSFEDGFAEWRNPHGDQCPGSGLAAGWVAFTSQDQYGSSCMNQTVWAGNVHSGESAQEITFAYVGVEAGVFRSAPTIPGHRYTVEAFMKREFSVATLQVSLGLDPTGGVDWQAEGVQWFPWNEDVDDEWGRTEATITAVGESMTIFLKGSHPYPEPGGTLRLDNISITDNGPE